MLEVKSIQIIRQETLGRNRLNNFHLLRRVNRQIVKLDQASAVEEEKVKELRLFANGSV